MNKNINEYNLLNDILFNLEKQHIYFDSNTNFHLAIFTSDVIRKIKDGYKTYESRWSKFRHRPYKRISNGDVVFIKESNGPVVAYFVAEDISFEKNDNPYLMMKKYYSKTGFELKQYSSNVGCYITFMKMEKLTFVNAFKVIKKDCQTWVCLN